MQEDRWGGEMNWNKEFRGGDSIYGESIYTKRWEVFGVYQLPFKENIMLQFSANTLKGLNEKFHSSKKEQFDANEFTRKIASDYIELMAHFSI